MQMRTTFALLISMVMSLSALAGDGWVTDFEAAKRQAAEKKLPMLVDFTGSDWCGWCVRLKKEVFDEQAFQDYAKDNLVLVELDFPRRKEQPQELKEANRKLLGQFGVRGFPTIVLLNPEGVEVARTGYRPGGPAAYIEHLKELLGKKPAAEVVPAAAKPEKDGAAGGPEDTVDDDDKAKDVE